MRDAAKAYITVRRARRAKTTKYTSDLELESVVVGDVGVVSLPALLAVRARADDLDPAVLVAVDVGIAPGVVGDALDVPALLVALGDGRGGRRLHQRVQPLLGAGVEAVVQPVQLRRILEALDLRPRRRALRLVHLRTDPGDHQRRQQAQDHHHHHDLDQGEARPAGHTNSSHHLIIKPPVLSQIRRLKIVESCPHP